MAILIATHDMDLVPLICDRVYILKSGTLHASGSVQEVFSKPDELYLAGLCLPYITQLMLQLKKHPNFALQDLPSTVQEAYDVLYPLLE